MWRCSPWAFLPPVYSVCTAAGLWLVYFVAVSTETVRPLGSQHRRGNNTKMYPPIISIAGNFPPASCIFSEVMNLAAFVGFIIGVLRYMQLKSRLGKSWLNVCSLVAFSIGCFGMTLIGNFQLFTDGLIHNSGTLMTFGLGTLFCWMQSFITLGANMGSDEKAAAIARFVLSGCITVCMCLKTYFGLMSLYMQEAQSQWALVMFFLIFIGTFGIEFRHSRFEIISMEASRRPVLQAEASEWTDQQLDQL
ncbi:transmembrane protein 150C [Parambassis ranga]|uniref:Transmembrane protein 150C n=1 Tax=Parambassis ranga TaxID=210632 RepID=A0A6P7JCQ9_9TELE|nr:transmembrane protein 150C [Parambassis ranga]